MARSATIEIDARTADARVSMESLEQSVRDTDAEVEQLDDSLIGLTRSATTSSVAMKAAGAAAQSAGDDMDDMSTSSRQARRDLKLAFDEVGRITAAISALSPAVKATTVAVAGLTTGLVALEGALLAVEGAGVALAARFGPQGVQNDFKQLKAEARDAAQVIGRTFVAEAQFAKQALSGLVDLFEENASFLRGAGAVGIAAFSGAAPNVTSFVRALAERGRQAATSMEALSGKLKQFNRLRKQGEKRADILEAAGAPRKKALETQVSVYEDIIEKLSKFAATLEGVPRREATAALRDYQRRLQGLRSELEAAGQTAPTVDPIGIGPDREQQFGPLPGPRTPPSQPAAGGGAFDRRARRLGSTLGAVGRRRALRGATGGAAFQSGIQNAREYTRALQELGRVAVNVGPKLRRSLVSGVRGVTRALVQGGNPLRAFAKTAGTLFQRVGSAIVLQSKAMQAVLSGGFAAAIPLGLSLVAAGTALKAALGSQRSQLGGSGGGVRRGAGRGVPGVTGGGARATTGVSAPGRRAPGTGSGDRRQVIEVNLRGGDAATRTLLGLLQEEGAKLNEVSATA